MSDIVDDRKKALEEAYFRKKEQELIEKLKQRARVAADREGLAEATGVTNEQILEAFREMGLDRETVALLHFIPLLEVAWSDGSVSAKERAGILELARARERSWKGRRRTGSYSDGSGTGPTPCSSAGREQ